MAEAKHTPGPWFPVPYGDGQDTVICKDEAGNKRIAFMAVPGCRDQQERRKVWREIEANARLIASAPELLDDCEKSAVALDEAANLLEGKGLSGCARIMRQRAEEARTVIAKAKGGAS